MRRTPAALAHLLFSAIAALLVLAAAEGGLRLLGAAAHGEGTAPSWMDAETLEFYRTWTANRGLRISDVSDLAGWQRDPLLRWSLKPKLSMTARNIFVDPRHDERARWRLTTNSRGFRTPEFLEAKPAGTLRIVVLGDSNSMGWLLDDDETYPRRLETHLSRLTGKAVEVINLGVGGYTSFSVRQLFEREALRLSPDAVVLSCGSNDDQHLRTSDAAYAVRFSGALGRVRHRLGGLRLASALQGLLPARAGGRVLRAEPEEFAANVEAMAAEATRRSIPVVFLKVCFTNVRYLEHLETVASRHGMPVVDAEVEIVEALGRPEVWAEYQPRIDEIAALYTPEERQSAPHLLYLFRDSCHLNALGADLAAAALARTLASLL